MRDSASGCLGSSMTMEEISYLDMYHLNLI